MTTERNMFTAHTIADLAATLPTLMGFHPQHSIVAVATKGPRCTFGFRLRIDIPRTTDNAYEVGALIARHLLNNGAEGMILMGTGSSSERDLAALTMDSAVLHAAGAYLVRSLWIDEDAHMVWSLDDPEVDPLPLTPDHEAVIQAIAAGQNILPSRAALVETFASRDDSLSWAVEDEIEHAHAEDIEAVDAERALMRMLSASPNDPLLPTMIATVGLGAMRIHVRDHIWGLLDRDNAAEMCKVLHTVATAVPADMIHGSMALTAFAYWLNGKGPQSLIAAERVLELDPEYRMADLIVQLNEGAINPAKWTGFDAL